MRIAILLTVYNRAALTRSCLSRLNSLDKSKFKVDIYVVDGGSTDGTQEMLKMDFPNVKSSVFKGAFWNQGMLHAWRWASKQEYDFYVWLNDDVVLSENWLYQLMELYKSVELKSIVVGKIADLTTGIKIYGALFRKRGLSQINFTTFSNSKVSFATFNGNCVLIPNCVFRELRFLDSAFSHSFGDIDYGLRARKSGIPIWETKSAVGTTTKSENIYAGNISAVTSIYEIFSPKGIPPVEWYKFCKSHGGYIWPINFIFRYLKLFIMYLRGRIKLNGT